MRKVPVTVAAFVAGVIVAGGVAVAAQEDAAVLVPQNAVEVEACFALADAIRDTRGGESAYNVCASRVNAYDAWKASQ